MSTYVLEMVEEVGDSLSFAVCQDIVVINLVTSCGRQSAVKTIRKLRPATYGDSSRRWRRRCWQPWRSVEPMASDRQSAVSSQRPAMSLLSS